MTAHVAPSSTYRSGGYRPVRLGPAVCILRLGRDGQRGGTRAGPAWAL
jgi:hypothetical protein